IHHWQHQSGDLTCVTTWFIAEGMIVDQTLAFPQSPQNTPPESISPPQYEHFVSPVEKRTPTTSSFSYLLAYHIAPSINIIMGMNSAMSANGPPSGEASAVPTRVTAQTYFLFFLKTLVPTTCSFTNRTKMTGIVNANPETTRTKKIKL